MPWTLTTTRGMHDAAAHCCTNVLAPARTLPSIDTLQESSGDKYKFQGLLQSLRLLQVHFVHANVTTTYSPFAINLHIFHG